MSPAMPQTDFIQPTLSDFTAPTTPEQGEANATVARKIIRAHIDNCLDGRFQERGPNDPSDPRLIAFADELWRDGQQSPGIGILLPGSVVEEIDGALTLVCGNLELIAAHRRRDARRLNNERYLRENPDATASEWLYMDVDIREDVTPVEMFRIAWSDNHQRLDLNAIEKAKYIRYLRGLGMTQAEAAAELGLTQSAGSHLESLLDLPDAIQAQIGDGAIPERHARNIRSVHRWSPAVAERIAQAVATADSGSKDTAAERAYSLALLDPSIARPLNKIDQPFDPNKPLTLDEELCEAATAAGIQRFVTACPPCEYFRAEREKICLNPACWVLKAMSAHLAAARERAANWNIPVLFTPRGETWQLVDDLCERYQLYTWASAILASRKSAVREHVRVVVVDTNGEDFSRKHNRKNYSGYSFITLATNNAAALLKAVPLPVSEAQEEAEESDPTTSAERKHQERQAKAAERKAEAEQRQREAEEAERNELKRVNLEMLKLASDVAANLFTAPLAEMVWGQLASDGSMTPVEFQELTPTEQCAFVMNTIIANEVEARIQMAGGAGSYFIYSPNKIFAKHLFEILATLDVHVPAQIAIICGQDQPAPKAKKAKRESKPKKPSKAAKPTSGNTRKPTKAGISIGKLSKRALANAAKK